VYHEYKFFHLFFPPSGALKPQLIQSRREECWKHLDQETKDTYGEGYFKQLYSNFESNIPRFPQDLSPVVRAIRAGLLSKRPQEKYPVGLGAGTLLCFYPLLPMFLADKISYAIGFSVKDKVPSAMQ
jgi:hypothetical protein